MCWARGDKDFGRAAPWAFGCYRSSEPSESGEIESGSSLEQGSSGTTWAVPEYMGKKLNADVQHEEGGLSHMQSMRKVVKSVHMIRVASSPSLLPCCFERLPAVSLCPRRRLASH